MENVKETLAKNLSELRRERKITQQELAKKLNYSDKAVSRWEHGETLPDIETLCKICDIYGVKFEYLLQKEKPQGGRFRQIDEMPNKVLIALIAVVCVWLSAIMYYTGMTMLFEQNAWYIFIWAIPLSSVCAQICNRFLFQSKIMKYVCASVTAWSMLLSVYVQLLYTFGENLWLLFILGIPIQLLIALTLVLRIRAKRK